MTNLNKATSAMDELYIQCQAALAREAGLLAEVARLKAEIEKQRQRGDKWEVVAIQALFALEQINNEVSGFS